MKQNCACKEKLAFLGGFCLQDSYLDEFAEMLRK
jgi:hypothetical protein